MLRLYKKQEDPLEIIKSIINNTEHRAVFYSTFYAWSLRSDPNWHNIPKKEAITRLLESRFEQHELTYWDFDIIQEAEKGDPAITKIHDPVCWILNAMDKKKNTNYENQYSTRIKSYDIPAHS